VKYEGQLERAALEGAPLPIPVIDVHAHIGALSAFHIPRPDGEGMVEVMDRVGVAAAAISANSAWAADMRTGNDLAAEAVSRWPGRFTAYCVVNPNYPGEIEDELKRCFDGLGFRMIKIHPSVHRVKMTDAAYEAVFEFAARRGAPVLTHTWVDDPHCGIEVAAEAARRHRGVTFLWGHSGGDDVAEALDEAGNLDNVFLELAASRVWNGQLELMVERFPVERIVFGSDFPFISLPQQVGKVVFADIAQEARRMILHDNAARLLAEAGVDLPG